MDCGSTLPLWLTQRGGVVRVPEGTWLTGAIQLRSYVNLHLDEGAVLRFSDDPDDYLPDFDGNGEKWWSWEPRQQSTVTRMYEEPIQRLRFQDVTINATKGFRAKLVGDMAFENVIVAAEEGPAFGWEDCEDVIVDGEERIGE